MADTNNMESGKGDSAHVWVRINLPYFRTTPGMVKLLQLFVSMETKEIFLNVFKAKKVICQMDNLVTTINKLQEVAALVGPEALLLPQIVIVGDQSSGKSSVVEGIVGKSFLPRGVGLVTRCPLILQLVGKLCETGRSSISSDSAVFLHERDKVYTDFEHVKEEISRLTDKRIRGNKCISSDAIILKVNSSNASNLTVVDLPGIVKVPVGDQPNDVEELIKGLILKYIRNPHSIILAVVTANTDIATSESLKLAREVDPDGLRTLAVVTKLDLMDQGTDATDILCGKIISLRMGIVGVVNRSQQDSDKGKSLSQTLKDEAIFFRDNYPKIANKNGTVYLSRKLHTLLLSHIERCLPNLRDRIKNNIIHYQNNLKLLGEDVTDENKTVLELLSRFSTTYCSAVTGTHHELETRELSGGARISYIFNETFGRALERMDPLSGFTRPAIITALRNAAGVRPSLFVPESCFELLVKKQIEKLEAPSLKCVRLIYEELERILHNCGPRMEFEMSRFPNLYNKIVYHVTDLLKSRLPETNAMVKNIISIQTAYINTAHPDFLNDDKISKTHCGGDFGREKSVLHLVQADGAQTDGTPKDCLLVETLIRSYFSIVKKTIQDSVPKVIMHFLVNHVMDKLLSDLVNKLYSGGIPKGILEESDDTIRKRKEIASILTAHQRANAILSEIKTTK